MKSKIIFVVLSIAVTVNSCSPIAKVAPIKTAIPMADNFFFVFKDYSCGTIPLNVLDTKNSTLTHTPLEDTESITIPFQLSENEKNEVFQKIMTIDFFSYPSDFVIPDDYLSATETPVSTYELSATNGVTTNTVHWSTGGLAQSEYEKANQLWELFIFIKLLIYNRPEYKELPSGAMCI